jgi:hypothetical protein
MDKQRPVKLFDEQVSVKGIGEGTGEERISALFYKDGNVDMFIGAVCFSPLPQPGIMALCLLLMTE